MNITFVYVTHDQEEALTMSDTVVVMSGGKIQQIGSPQDIYNEPKNAFVARFIGDSNIVDGVMLRDFSSTSAVMTSPVWTAASSPTSLCRSSSARRTCRSCRPLSVC